MKKAFGLPLQTAITSLSSYLFSTCLSHLNLLLLTTATISGSCNSSQSSLFFLICQLSFSVSQKFFLKHCCLRSLIFSLKPTIQISIATLVESLFYKSLTSFFLLTAYFSTTWINSNNICLHWSSLSS